MVSKAFLPTLDRSQVLFGIIALVVGGIIGVVVAGIHNPILALVMVIGLLVAGTTLLKPEWGLLALVVITYTNLSDVAIKYYYAPSITQPFILFLGLVILAQWVFAGNAPKGWQRALIVIGIYCLLGYFTVFFAANADQSLSAATSLVKNAIIAIVVVILLQRGIWLRRIIWILVMIGLVLGTLGVVQYLTGTFDMIYGGFARPPVVTSEEGVDMLSRITGPIGDPNYFGQIIVVLIPLALDRLWNERSTILRLLAAWSLGVCILATIFTYSRGSFIAMIIVLAVMIIRHPPKPIVLVLTIAVGVVILQFVPAHFTERVTTLVSFIPGIEKQEATVDESFRGRTSEMIAAWRMFTDHPVLGVGISNYNTRYQEYSRQLGIDTRRAERSAHSLYLEIAAEKGLVGLALFALLMGVTFHGLRQGYCRFQAAGMEEYAGIAMALSIAIVGYLFTAIFLHDAYSRYFWLLIGIAMAVPNVAANELAAHQQASQQAAKRYHASDSSVTAR